MNPNVFRAILAMDSYNRGYAPSVRIDLSGTSPIGRWIGTAEIINDSTNAIALATTRRVGFYASAYSWNGETIISYRGTNADPGDSIAEFLASPLVDDIWNGWSLGTGFAGAEQGQLALQFYQAVAGGDSFYEPQPLVTLTGHSLGGGLAGFVGALSGNRVYAYDHMPFGIAAYAQAIADAATAAAERVDLTIGQVTSAFPLISSVASIIDAGVTFGAFVEAFELEFAVTRPIIDGQDVFAIHLEGEVLEGIRDGSLQPIIGGAVGTLLGFIGGGIVGSFALDLILTTAGVAVGATTATLESGISVSEYQPYTIDSGFMENLDAVQRHSMPFLITVMYGQDQWPTESANNSTAEWATGFGYVAPSLFDSRIARVGLGRNGTTGSADPATQMSTMIAYSAINEGTRVFGDTGIRALSNDAADLGRALGTAGAPLALQAGGNGIGALIVEYAGLLAVTATLSANSPMALQGILTYRPAAGNRGNSLLIDLTEARWDAYGRDHDIVSKDNLIEGLIEADVANGRSLLNRIEDFYARNNGGANLLTSIDRASISLGGTLRPAQLTGTGTILTVLSDAGVTASFTGLTDFVFGGLGDDVIKGLSGDDILIGGGGDDQLEGGSDRDFLYGGTGSDILLGGAGADQLWSGPTGPFFEGYDLLDGGGGNDRLIFAGGYGQAIGGLGNDAIDARSASGDIEVLYRIGDGEDRLFSSIEAGSLTFGNLGTQIAAGPVIIRFEGYNLSDVRIEWAVTFVDVRVEPNSAAERLFVGNMRVLTLGGAPLFDLGDVAGIISNPFNQPGFGNYYSGLTMPTLYFNGDLFIAGEGANAAFVVFEQETVEPAMAAASAEDGDAAQAFMSPVATAFAEDIRPALDWFPPAHLSPVQNLHAQFAYA
jgi:Ca2+-binding RTX toxin-like protein